MNSSYNSVADAAIAACDQSHSQRQRTEYNKQVTARKLVLAAIAEAVEVHGGDRIPALVSLAEEVISARDMAMAAQRELRRRANELVGELTGKI